MHKILTANMAGSFLSLVFFFVVNYNWSKIYCKVDKMTCTCAHLGDCDPNYSGIGGQAALISFADFLRNTVRYRTLKTRVATLQVM